MNEYNMVQVFYERMKYLTRFNFTLRDAKILFKLWMFVIKAYLTIAIIFLLPVGVLEAADRLLGLVIELVAQEDRPFTGSDYQLFVYCISVLSIGTLIYFLSWGVLAKEHSKHTKKFVFMGGKRFRLMLKIGLACIPLTMWIYSTTSASVWALPFKLLAKL